MDIHAGKLLNDCPSRCKARGVARFVLTIDDEVDSTVISDLVRIRFSA